MHTKLTKVSVLNKIRRKNRCFFAIDLSSTSLHYILLPCRSESFAMAVGKFTQNRIATVLSHPVTVYSRSQCTQMQCGLLVLSLAQCWDLNTINL